MKLIVLILSFAFAKNVESVKDFTHHIEFHRMRVIELGLALADEFYPNIDKQKLKNFLLLHDKAKSIYVDDLYLFYGKELTGDQRDNLRHLVKEMNDLDSRIAQDFFRFNNQAPADYYEIEKIADQVDRGMDPVAEEEFGRRMTRASVNLGAKARWLEERYFEITRNSRFLKNSCKLLYKKLE